MPVSFPPIPIYPTAFDDDSTLFLVFNTTETIITSDVPAWGEEIDIKPVRADAADIWADNGFATISGELLYYDSVNKNGFGHVTKLKNCVRNLGGTATQFNAAGTYIRGFVIAEHHNQIVDAIINLEEFLGDQDCTLEDAVTCCLEELEASPGECPDDGNCPIIDFAITDITESEDNCTGTTISYTINVNGVVNQFDLDFGDGTNTTSTESGSHVFPPGANIDLIITASNDFCEVIVTPTGASEIPISTPTTPGIPGATPFSPGGPPPNDPFIFPVPNISIPNISITPIECPSIDISLPPLVEPCFELNPFGQPDINFGTTDIDINVPSTIAIVPPIPSSITITPQVPETITITPPIPTIISVIDDIPEIISVIDDIPEIISLIDDLPSCISICEDLPSCISLCVPDIPNISVDWGTPPTISACITIRCPSSSSAAPFVGPIFDEDDFLWDDNADATWPKQAEQTTTKSVYPTAATPVTPIKPPSTPTIEASVDFDEELLGIPSEIIIHPPIIPDINIRHNLPSEINLNCPTIPEQISFVGLESLPTSIELVAPSDLAIPIDASSLPQSIAIDWGNAPRSLMVSFPDIPTICVEHDIPTTISVEGIPPTISVEGIPDSIAVTGFPKSLKVDPVEVIVKLDMQNLITNRDEEGYHCVAIVPCNPR